MTPSRRARLRRLGVDVWVRRGTREQRAAVEAQSTPQSVALAASARRAVARPAHVQAPGPSADGRSGAQAAAKQAPKAATEQPPERAERRQEAPPATPFHIRCFHFGDVFAAIGEDAWPQRRMLLDVALALNRFRAAERHDVLFSWPQPGVDPNAGDRAFRAFFAHRVPSGGVALVAGARVPDLLGQDAASDSGWLDNRGEEAPALYVAPGALDANAKRALWALAKALA